MALTLTTYGDFQFELRIGIVSVRYQTKLRSETGGCRSIVFQLATSVAVGWARLLAAATSFVSRSLKPGDVFRCVFSG